MSNELEPLDHECCPCVNEMEHAKAESLVIKTRSRERVVVMAGAGIVLVPFWTMTLSFLAVLLEKSFPIDQVLMNCAQGAIILILTWAYARDKKNGH